MKVACLLSFYDESPAWLASVVSGFGRFCDEIVAVDGAYAYFPGGERQPRSPIEQTEAILTAAEALGVGCTVHRPSSVFYGNEVEKRNATLRLAATLEPDWIVVADSDYHITSCDPITVRGLLETTDLNAAEFVLTETDDSSRWEFAQRDIFRWTPDLEYGPAHYCIRGTYDGRLQWVRGPMAEGDALDLRGSLIAAHRSKGRPAERQDRAQRYYAARDAAEIESLG